MEAQAPAPGDCLVTTGRRGVMRLEGKTAIITGAASGQGAAAGPPAFTLTAPLT